MDAVSGSARRRNALLLSPALLFLLILFVVPISELLFRSIYDNGFTLRFYQQIVDNPVYLTVIGLTFRMVTVVTLVCLVLGYPLALYIAGRPPSLARWVRMLVLIPLLISVIVRTYAWMVLLGTNGILNKTLQALQVIAEPIKILYTFNGVVIGMAYVMLPLAVLTLESVMRNVDPNVMRAAHNLGASKAQAFWRIFFPLTLPGVAGGALLVFITSLGYYITPTLLGGPKDAVIAMLIARQVEYSMNWGFASSLAVLLLATTLVGFLLVNRVVGLQRIFEARA
jgi:putative spermidine/putrescine transport system permease protein